MDFIQAWILSYIISISIKVSGYLIIEKKLTDNGYKLNKKQKKHNYFSIIIDFIPVINIIKNLLHFMSISDIDKTIKEFKKDDILKSMNREEIKKYQQNSKLIKDSNLKNNAISCKSEKVKISSHKNKSSANLTHRKIRSIQNEVPLIIEYAINTNDNQFEIIDVNGSTKELDTEELKQIIVKELSHKLEDLTQELASSKPTQNIIDNEFYKETLIKQRQILIEEREMLFNANEKNKKILCKKNIK